MFPSISTQRLNHKNDNYTLDNTNRSLRKQSSLNKYNHVNEILNSNMNRMNSMTNLNNMNSNMKNKQLYNLANNMSNNNEKDINSNTNEQNPTYYGRFHSQPTPLHQLFRKLAHEDIQLKQSLSSQLKRQQLQQNMRYRKQIQNKALRSLQKGLVFRKVFLY